ncbi:MAG: pantothenate kinase [Alphaproteobacteria bacterium TMED87]|nr:pantothenate kinase [Rhodospirillaceae bacterium]OUV09592.1 MAG: pantothenate kinase [Alphaproteobacteria bacterium TMED87]|tara:strand:+ start:265 stop:1041 length:777 start_codon:yes stop_codon:yes gene_type:complete
MLLAIDCGNTNVVFSVFDSDTLIVKWRSSTNADKTSDDYSIWLEQLLQREKIQLNDINYVIISSVVPNKNETLRRLCISLFKIEPSFIGSSEINTNLSIQINNPNELGADRVVNAVAAHHDYGGPLIIIDFGTATTFDIIDTEGSYIGGVITPGINLSLDALHQSTALLPRISLRKPVNKSILGKSTVEAMNSGIYWGYVGLIEGIVNKIKKDINLDFKIIATGGLAHLFSDTVNHFFHVDDNLTLKGLMIVHKRNIL